ncbi:MAG TPA: ribonuclease H-like domain-containing protein [Bryobacteraceae bacterium]|nr:ribonuclease H-like domain-containing protein [Bryobacteraceae bacterium]
MTDQASQIAKLRKRIARIDRKYSSAALTPGPSPDRAAARSFIEEWAEGAVVENECGSHFQMEKRYAAHARHGSADIGALSELPPDLLGILNIDSEVPPSPPERWAFLDTETTGLMGDSGVYAFLIGVGRITKDGFSVRQFFMREYAEEKSVLTALSGHLENFDTLVTYNGKTYDQPLLENRYRVRRLEAPFHRLAHVDLLHGSRRIWKLRYDNCKLSFLENRVLGVERHGDLAGELIPYVYFEYLRSGEALRLVPIFHHNAIDILSLGCLTAVVPSAFRAAAPESLEAIGLRRGEEFLGIARWFQASGEQEKALALLHRAVDLGLPDSLLFGALWAIGRLEKRAGRHAESIRIVAELAECKNPYRVNALAELARHYEHQERNFDAALEFARLAAEADPSETAGKRIARLKAKISRRAAQNN